MDDLPYTTPDEDPFNVRPLPPHARTSSLLDKWINEQQRYPPSLATHTRSASAHATSQAYLAYPDLNRPTPNRPSLDISGDAGYDLVDDDDIPQNLAADLNNLTITNVPATLRATKTHSRMSLSPSSFRHFNLVFRSSAPSSPTDDQAISSRKSIFTRSNRAPNNTDTVTARDISTAPSPPQKNLSARSSQFFRGTSLNRSSSNSAPKIRLRPSPPKWRPSVLGHFGQSQGPSIVPVASQTSVQAPTDSLYTPSRPSFSSSVNTHTSLTVPSPEGSTGRRQASPSFSERGRVKRYSNPVTPARPRSQRNSSRNTFSGHSTVSFRSEACGNSKNTTDLLSPDSADKTSLSPTLSSSTAPRGFHPSIRSNSSQYSSRRSANTFDAITPTSYRSQYSRTDEGEGVDNDGAATSAPVTAEEQQQERARKKKPHVVYSSGSHGNTLSRMTSLSNINLAMIPKNRKKRKKLIIGGVAPDDVEKFEGVKRWCESFGEVRQILRLPNGDLVVSFKSAEVADTVCRIRAKVLINGVGSVHLSWTTEKKR